MLLHLPSVCLFAVFWLLQSFLSICNFMFLFIYIPMTLLSPCRNVPVFTISDSLPAATALHHHVLIILQHNAVLMVKVEEGNGAEGGGNAAGPGHRSIHSVYHSLNHGMAGGIHVVSQRITALSQAKEGIVATGSNDPLVPTHIFEIYIQGMTTASATGKALQFCWMTTISFHPSTIAPADPSFITPPALHSIPYFFGPPPALVSIVALAAISGPCFWSFSPSYPLVITRGFPVMFD